jgi:hypothetical protein
MQKVTIKVVAEKKVDNRTNNTGRPVNHTSARQVRLSKQYMTELDMDYVMNGGWFKLTTNCSGAYTFVKGDGEFNEGHIATMLGNHECNIDTIGRSKMSGYTYVMNKRVSVEFDVRRIIRVGKS